MAKVNGLFQDAEEAKFDRYTHIMMDERAFMHYVRDRLEDILEDVNLDTNKVLELRLMLLYNLGINQRIIHGEENA